MLKLFISQPIDGKPLKVDDLLRENVVDWVKDKYGDIELLNSSFTSTKDPVKRIGKSLTVLADADIVYFMRDFDQDIKCRAEFEACYRHMERKKDLIVILEYSTPHGIAVRTLGKEEKW